MLNAQWLNTFITLVEIGHFTKTAEKLFMTQPGVSQHIKKLEVQLNAPLIEKTGKQFELTDAGQKVYQYALTLQQHENALMEAVKVDSPYIGSCLFSMSGSLCMQFQAVFLDRQIEHPSLFISLESAPNYRIVDELLNRKIDLGIVTQKIPSPQLEYQLIGEEKLCLVVPKGFDSQDWNLNDLKSLGIINHPDCEHYLLQFLSAYNQEHELNNIQHSGYINQLSQILYPVAKGLGFTLLPSSAVNAFPDLDQITILPLTTEIKESLYLVQKRYRSLPARYDWFIKTIQASFCST
mgnify:CR=1 FL=1